jgi:hypothetical protein
MDVASAAAACAEMDAAQSASGVLVPIATLSGRLPVDQAQAWPLAPLLLEAEHEAVGEASQGLASANAPAGDSAGAAVLEVLRADPEAAKRIAEGLVAALDQRDQVDVPSLSARSDGTAVVEVQYTNLFRPSPRSTWDPLIDGTWWDWRDRVFRREPGLWLGYVRVLAPNGSRLLDSSGWDDAPTTSSEGSATVFGAPLLVRPRATRTVRLVYADPAPVDAPITVFQQPGAS